MKIRTLVGNGRILVSTVRLVIPAGKDRYETMVFNATNGKVTNFEDIDFDRYETEEQAKAGHEALVAKWEAEAK